MLCLCLGGKPVSSFGIASTRFLGSFLDIGRLKYSGGDIKECSARY
jgi:hypothetical protein